MRQPLSRDRQIQLATGYETRVEKHAEKLLRVPVIRESISRANPKQGERSSFTTKSIRSSKCG